MICKKKISFKSKIDMYAFHHVLIYLKKKTHYIAEETWQNSDISACFLYNPYAKKSVKMSKNENETDI